MWPAIRTWRSPAAFSWRLILLAIGLRVLLSPLQHTWDSQTWLNTAALLGSDPNPFHAIAAPFEMTRRLTDLARGSGESQFFEYWAYPPGMLIVWWPLARLWTLL